MKKALKKFLGNLLRIISFRKYLYDDGVFYVTRIPIVNVMNGPFYLPGFKLKEDKKEENTEELDNNRPIYGEMVLGEYHGKLYKTFDYNESGYRSIFINDMDVGESSTKLEVRVYESDEDIIDNIFIKMSYRWANAGKCLVDRRLVYKDTEILLESATYANKSDAFESAPECEANIYGFLNGRRCLLVHNYVVTLSTSIRYFFDSETRIVAIAFFSVLPEGEVEFRNIYILRSPTNSAFFVDSYDKTKAYLEDNLYYCSYDDIFDEKISSCVFEDEQGKKAELTKEEYDVLVQNIQSSPELVIKTLGRAIENSVSDGN